MTHLIWRRREYILFGKNISTTLYIENVDRYKLLGNLGFN